MPFNNSNLKLAFIIKEREYALIPPFLGLKQEGKVILF